MRTIHAYAAKAPGAHLEPFTYEAPPPGPFDILIQVTHTSLCHSDIHLIDDDWKRSAYPLVPGHEVVGTILEKGALVQWPIGARVGVGWVLHSCLNCSSCLAGETQVCPTKKLTCVGHFGGFADKMTADSRFAYAIPEGLDSASAAPLLCAGATVYAPLRRFKAQAPDRLGVIGIGGLGHLALQFASAFSRSVTAFSTSANKEQEAKSFGATHFVTLSDLKQNASEHALSYDLILSTVHSAIDWNLILSLLKPSGVLCFLGRPSEDLTVDVGSVLSNQRMIAGSTTANRSLMNEMLEFAAKQNIRPKIEQMKLKNVNQAIARLRANEVRYRIVMTP